MENKHTPTLWEVHEDWNGVVELFGGDPFDKFKNITNILELEDAFFVVRAVNCHEEIVMLLKKLYLEKELGSNQLVYIGELIVKAEGK